MAVVQSPIALFQYNRDDEQSVLTGIRNQSQVQKRRILDLENQFEDARVRIDKLLQRKSIRRNTYDSVSNSSSFVTPSASFNSGTTRSSTMNIDRSDSMDSTSSTELHKTQININPTNNAKQTFGTVTLTVKVDED